jgi:hypothetical protein
VAEPARGRELRYHFKMSRIPTDPTPAACEAPARDPRPRFEVIPLDCEITAYAPDGGDPLF